MSDVTHTCPGYISDPPEVQTALDDAGFWIGCEHPERPADRFMVTIEGCPGCDIAEEAAVRHGGICEVVSDLGAILERIGVTP